MLRLLLSARSEAIGNVCARSESLLVRWCMSCVGLGRFTLLIKDLSKKGLGRNEKIDKKIDEIKFKFQPFFHFLKLLKMKHNVMSEFFSAII